MRKLTTEQFILSANAKHHGKYMYDKVVYVTARTPITITCPIHGDFKQTPSSHTNKGSGCVKCAGTEKLTRDEFIRKSKTVHGDKYDYSLVKYKNNTTKVNILCRDHGTFMQLPAAHMAGRGCSCCGGTAKNTKETYLLKVQYVHGDRYAYEKVVYTDINSKITITCKEHGDFSQVAASHLAGRGCPVCAGKNKTTASFIDEAKLLHGDTYDYKNVVYKTAKDFIKIGCLEHGEFLQTPDAHLHGKGCKKCALQSKVTTEDFINKANLVHGGRYDYSLTKYVANHVKIKIICKDHGVYEQRPNGHISAASGCPHCSDHGFKLDDLGVFYIIKTENFIGFGITNNLDRRIKTHGRLLKRNKIKYFIKGVFYGAGTDIFRFEQMIKREFKPHIVNTGIDGFKTEALSNVYLEPLLDLCKRHLTNLTKCVTYYKTIKEHKWLLSKPIHR